MGNQGTEWGEWWKCGEPGWEWWEWGESEWDYGESGWACGEYNWNRKFTKFNSLFLLKLKKKQNYNCHKMLIFVLWN